MTEWTIWDKNAAGGQGAVVVHVIRSHSEPVDPEYPEGAQQTVVDESRALDRVGHLPGDSGWIRPVLLNTLAARLAPRAAGAMCYQDGWVLLERLDAPVGGIPTGQKLGAAREVPLVDLEVGTAVWYTLVDLSADELSAQLAATAVSRSKQNYEAMLLRKEAALRASGEHQKALEASLRRKGIL